MSFLSKVKLAVSPLSGAVVMYRHGKDPAVALEKRNVEEDVFTVLIDHMMASAPRDAEKCVTVDGQQYLVRVTPTRSSNHG